MIAQGCRAAVCLCPKGARPESPGAKPWERIAPCSPKVQRTVTRWCKRRRGNGPLGFHHRHSRCFPRASPRAFELHAFGVEGQ